MENDKIKKSYKINKNDFIYISVISIFFIIIIIIFINSAEFFIENINKIFSKDNETNYSALDIEKYKLIEKKLNLPINNTNENIVNKDTEIQKEMIPVEAENPTITSINTNTPIIEKEEIKPSIEKEKAIITILNGSRKTNKIEPIIKKLKDAGFSRISTSGNTENVYKTTTILVKKSKNDYISFIKEAIKNIHPKIITKINPEKSKFDIILIIGKE